MQLAGGRDPPALAEAGEIGGEFDGGAVAAVEGEQGRSPLAGVEHHGAHQARAGPLGRIGAVEGGLELQNLAVASAAVGLDGAEGTLFRKLIGWSLGLLALITLLIFLQSTPVLGWMVP